MFSYRFRSFTLAKYDMLVIELSMASLALSITNSHLVLPEAFIVV